MLKAVIYCLRGISFVGIFFLLLSLLGWSCFLLPNRQLLGQIGKESAGLQEKIAVIDRTAHSSSYAAEQFTQSAKSIFSNQNFLENIQKLSELASSYELNFLQANYQDAKVATGALLYNQISLPLRGNYSAISAFISKALNIPGCALAAVKLSRQQVVDPELEAELEFRFYFNDPVSK